MLRTTPSSQSTKHTCSPPIDARTVSIGGPVASGTTGAKAEPHTGALTSATPMVWSPCMRSRCDSCGLAVVLTAAGSAPKSRRRDGGAAPEAASAVVDAALSSQAGAAAGAFLLVLVEGCAAPAAAAGSTATLLAPPLVGRAARLLRVGARVEAAVAP